ncbi:MAG TPA: hypothetical protein VF183_11350, partial [Acidimicrobiales bacterium]
GAIPETVGDAGIVLPPDTGARHLAEAVRRVLDDELLRRALVERGRARRERYSVDSTVVGTLRALHRLIAEPRLAPA